MQAKPAIATGWLLWLTWIFVVAIGGGAIMAVLIGILGPDLISAVLHVTVTMPHLTVWWVVEQAAYAFFAITCVGVLLRDRDIAGFAVPTAWIIVGLQCIGAFTLLFRGHLQIPIGAALYIAFAISLRGRLYPTLPVAPPGSRGML
jgi:hypothetical protein